MVPKHHSALEEGAEENGWPKLEFLNRLNLLLFFSSRQLHTPTNLFLLSLAVSDFLVGLLLMPIRILLTGGCWVLGSLMCALFNYSSFIITSASVGNMVLISVDRYIAICDPLCYHVKVTQKRVQICICLCWGCSVFYNGVILKDHLKDPDRFNSGYGECVLWIDFLTVTFDVVVTFFAPITVIVVLYMRVFVVAVSQARAMRSHTAAVNIQGSVCRTDMKSERKAATALGVVVIVFICSFCPYFYPTLAGQDILSNEVLLKFGIWLFYFNSCLNPLIYAFFYPWFRKSLKYIITLQILQPSSCDINIFSNTISLHQPSLQHTLFSKITDLTRQSTQLQSLISSDPLNSYLQPALQMPPPVLHFCDTDFLAGEQTLSMAPSGSCQQLPLQRETLADQERAGTVVDAPSRLQRHLKLVNL
ncbi:trace amine-associated receptor 13c-like [Anableps anableps]